MNGDVKEYIILEQIIKRNEQLSNSGAEGKVLRNMAELALSVVPLLYEREDSKKPFSYDIEESLKKIKQIDPEFYKQANDAYNNLKNIKD